MTKALWKRQVLLGLGEGKMVFREEEKREKYGAYPSSHSSFQSCRPGRSAYDGTLFVCVCVIFTDSIYSIVCNGYHTHTYIWHGLQAENIISILSLQRLKGTTTSFCISQVKNLHWE